MPFRCFHLVPRAPSDVRTQAFNQAYQGRLSSLWGTVLAL